MNDRNTSRMTHIYGSMNSMYYVDQNKTMEDRYIRMQGKYYPDRTNQSQSYIEENFNEQIEINSFKAWILLFTSILFSAFVPCWLLADIKSEPLTRNSWRYFTVTILLLPFLLYEQRKIKDQSQKFLKQLTSQKLKPIFIGSINFCLWLTCLIYACRFTSMNHAICLSYLRFFLISAIKIVKKQRIHEFQIAGSILCTIGVLLVMSDSVLIPQSLSPTAEHYQRMEPWKRLILGDGLAFFSAFVAVYLDHHFTIPEMPRFTYLYLYNLFLSFNLVTCGYFFGGSEFSFNTKFGIFGLFTYQNFVGVFYVSVMLGFYLMIVNILISQIFNDVIINAGISFEIILTSIVWHMLGLQLIPANMTCLGYAFITPGLIFVIGGQGALENKQNKINFELYRPTQIRNTTYVDQSQGLVNSFSQERERNYDSPMKQKSRIFDKMPFQMILEEDQTQAKNVKNQ